MKKTDQISLKDQNSFAGNKNNEFGFIPKAQFKNYQGDSLENSSIDSFKNIGKGAKDQDLAARSLVRKRKSTWNSVNFENEDFLNGFATI